MPDTLSAEEFVNLRIKCGAILAGLEAFVRFKSTYQYNTGEILLDNQTATAEWEG